MRRLGVVGHSLEIEAGWTRFRRLRGDRITSSSYDENKKMWREGSVRHLHSSLHLHQHQLHKLKLPRNPPRDG